jgi:hypothetical protein
LVTDDEHELHLHVHHEYWTQNSSRFDHPVSGERDKHPGCRSRPARSPLPIMQGGHLARDRTTIRQMGVHTWQLGTQRLRSPNL